MTKEKAIDPEKRVDQIKRLLDCKSDSELARQLEALQPQIGRWKRGEISNSMANLVDRLLSITSSLKREIVRLKREIKTLKLKCK